MALMQDIEGMLKEAMRQKDENKRNAVRLLLTAIKNKEKELRRLPDDAEIQQIIGSQIKQRRDSVEQFTKAGRGELAAREEAEIETLRSFLPEALSPEALSQIIDEAIAEVGAQSAREMGKIMKVLMPKVVGRADGKQVNELVRQKLQG
ncbi:GatB/YqeY domain-containing protein [Desulforhabdus sp. TSK]|uniref:GatB/YqeY domain-containing protein n=1 Tax=Desulforhabdus sp. TSK TaxID=2925014 RepID=UPI001FC81BD4|nr:GatB/YqeY domain-containing protein [Desulforhabdus sp. TSK]GKT08041.1 aspartyl-tRNA amidotransferase subunit B [Desulforhabdus sp. TSK]